MEPTELLIHRACRFKKKPAGLGCLHCGKAKSHADHLGAPPSLNVLGSGNKFLYQGFKNAWGAVFAAKLKEACFPLCNRVVVEGAVCFGDRQKRDQGNYRFILEKALGDTLVSEGYLPDDTWEQYTFGGLELIYVPRQSFTRLLLFPA